MAKKGDFAGAGSFAIGSTITSKDSETTTSLRLEKYQGIGNFVHSKITQPGAPAKKLC
jgi:hypothetical protein